MKLLPAEEILMQSDDNSVVLTSHRILQEEKSTSRAINRSIMLQHVTSCENTRTNFVSLLVIASLFTLGFVYYFLVEHNYQVATGAAGLALICFLGYFFTRSNHIVVKSPSSKIAINAGGMSREKALEFIYRVEKAIETKVSRLEAV